jgi:hypothetical protein
MDNKSREFWIIDHALGDGKTLVENTFMGSSDKPTDAQFKQWPGKFIHVIEYSAYEALNIYWQNQYDTICKQLEAAKAAYEDIYAKYANSLNDPKAKVERQRDELQNELAAEKAKSAKLAGLAQKIKHQTERKERGCKGSHTQYSSMSNDRICPICKQWEDGPGGDIVTYEPTNLAKEAVEALAEYNKEEK